MRYGTLFLALIAVSLVGCGPPPDTELIRVFQANRSTLETLRARACALDRYAHISSSDIDPKLGASDAAWFLDRISKIGVESLSVHGIGNSCWLSLSVWSSGFAGTPADYKGYHWGALDLHDRTMTTKVVESLDSPPLNSGIVTLDRNLGQGWWLEYTSYP
jgi:hypothetical protein